MPRAESNPEGQIWGIRITPVSEARSEALRKISGIVVVVHEKGVKSKAEHPHYHIYYDHSFIAKKSQVCEHLKKIWLTVFNGLDGRKGGYSFNTGSDYTIESYWDYCWDEIKKPGRKPSLLCWNLSTPQLVIPDVIVHDFGEEVVAPVVVAKTAGKRTTKEKMEYFYQNEVKPWVEENPGLDLDKRRLVKLLYHYWHNKDKPDHGKLQAVQQYVDYAEFRYYQDAGESRKTQFQFIEDDWVERAMTFLKVR